MSRILDAGGQAITPTEHVDVDMLAPDNVEAIEILRRLEWLFRLQQTVQVVTNPRIDGDDKVVIVVHAPPSAIRVEEQDPLKMPAPTLYEAIGKLQDLIEQARRSGHMRDAEAT